MAQGTSWAVAVTQALFRSWIEFGSLLRYANLRAATPTSAIPNALCAPRCRLQDLHSIPPAFSNCFGGVGDSQKTPHSSCSSLWFDARGAIGASETKPDQYICLSFKSFQATRHSGSHCSCCQTARHISSPVSCICIAVLNPCNRNCSDRRAHGVVVSHPLRMRKALGSIPSVSNLLPSLR